MARDRAASGGNVFEDLSGASSSTSGNPYDTLLSLCQNDQNQIQDRYATHRTTRNAQQKAKLLDASFQGFNIDPVLYKLSNRTLYPGFVDPRHCLVFWARPPAALKVLIGKVQNLWLMPLECLHMTALEITHSQTAHDIDLLVKKLSPDIPTITDYPNTHRARLIKPTLSYDSAAIALSFVPAAGEDFPFSQSSSKPTQSTDDQNKANPDPEVGQDDSYTYHHLRRSLYELCVEAGVEVASRYTVPSAHLTVARFITQKDISAPPVDDDEAQPLDETKSKAANIAREKVQMLVDKIEAINAWLQDEYWPKKGREQRVIKKGGEWIVGEEKGLDCRKGTLWYGGGETIRLGKGFSR
ncbi:MAG: hypothetical protein Q9195_002444 [Heterodermia aff. obscurata]